MKITYTPNPLNTIIELDEHEQQIFKYKIRISELEEAMGSASIYLDPKNASWVMAPSPGRKRPEPHTLETLIAEVRKNYLDMSYFYGDDTPDGEPTGLDKRVDELFEHFVDELKSSHAGDCTCFPMSCSKCHAESKLGLNTTQGLGKHEGSKLYGLFNYKDGEVWKERTLSEVLHMLRGYDPKPTKDSGWDKVGGFEKHIPRWKDEATRALVWLEKYQAEHFPQHQDVAGDTKDQEAYGSTP